MRMLLPVHLWLLAMYLLDAKLGRSILHGFWPIKTSSYSVYVSCFVLFLEGKGWPRLTTRDVVAKRL